MILSETFWVGAASLVLIALIAKPVGRAVANGLDNRSDRIKGELEEAQRLKEEAQALLALYQRKQKKTDEDVKNIIEHANEEAGRIIESAKKHLEAEVEKRTEIAVQKIAQAEACVIQEIRDNAVDLTISTARSLIRDNLAGEDADDIIIKAISGIDRKFH